jgi:hypothetical protein
MTYLSESVGGGDYIYYLFEEAFREQVSPGVLTQIHEPCRRGNGVGSGLSSDG